MYREWETSKKVHFVSGSFKGQYKLLLGGVATEPSKFCQQLFLDILYNLPSCFPTSLISWTVIAAWSATHSTPPSFSPSTGTWQNSLFLGLGFYYFFATFGRACPRGIKHFCAVWAVYIGNIVFVFLTKCLTNRSSALLTLQFCWTRESSAYFFFSWIQS